MCSTAGSVFLMACQYEIYYYYYYYYYTHTHTHKHTAMQGSCGSGGSASTTPTVSPTLLTSLPVCFLCVSRLCTVYMCLCVCV